MRSCSQSTSPLYNHPVHALGHIMLLGRACMHISKKRHVEYERVTRPSDERALRSKRYFFLSIRNIHKLSVNASSLWENPDFYVSSTWPHHWWCFSFQHFSYFIEVSSVPRSEKLVYLPFFCLLLSRFLGEHQAHKSRRVTHNRGKIAFKLSKMITMEMKIDWEQFFMFLND